ncbi:hypothetical protein SLS56_003942 [Neofusicoccum ribis]|uniref:Xaa-Pro dipeptidyl-peptidase C-terminal domain-containing protein n=1 Tax=Neofusicoccum ribis TaxID=45134 RepID=A0ABR3SYV5_9PEZI
MSTLQQRFPDIIWYKLRDPAESTEYKYDGFNPSTQILQKGHTRQSGRRPFDVDTVFERDVAVKLRDGTTIYTDIFRPTSSDERSHKVPAIIPWSPYGKTGRGTWGYEDLAPFRAGIPLSRTSGYEKFEAPDPAEWCGRGYAIMNMDSRGSADSEGNIVYYGQQEAEDIYDFVDWILARGGVLRAKFIDAHVRQFAGHNYVEKIADMARYDIYRPEANDDLQLFFDHYCRGIDNGWEKTPRVRLSLLGFCGSSAKTIIERPEEAWPIPRTEEKKYYLDAAQRRLTLSPPQQEASASYEAHSISDSLDLTVSFNEYTELAGHPVAKLWMSCKEKDDMDATVQIRKIKSDGRPLKWLNYPCPVPEEEVPDTNVAKTLGPEGWLRASHSCTKEYVDGKPFYTSRRSEPIPAGTIVPLEIPIWPIGMVFEKGEGIMLRIAGHDLRLPEVEAVRLTEPEDDNVGMHVVYTGGKYDSHLVLPIISSS